MDSCFLTQLVGEQQLVGNYTGPQYTEGTADSVSENLQKFSSCPYMFVSLLTRIYPRFRHLDDNQLSGLIPPSLGNLQMLREV